MYAFPPLSLDGDTPSSWVRDLCADGDVEPHPGPRFVSKNVNGVATGNRNRARKSGAQFCRAVTQSGAHFFLLPRRYFYYLQIARRTPLRFAQAKAPMLKGLL